MKFLTQPVSPFILTQGFGENKACVDIQTGRNVISCDGLSPPKGYKSLYGPKGHKGIDLAAKHGQPVYSAANGHVSSVDTLLKSGLDVRVLTSFQGKTYRHIYEHLLGYDKKIGDKVKTGDLIGWADNTGYSSGNHLHFQLEVWDEYNWIQIDPIPLMDDIFALRSASITKQIKEFAARFADIAAEILRK